MAMMFAGLNAALLLVFFFFSLLCITKQNQKLGIGKNTAVLIIMCSVASCCLKKKKKKGVLHFQSEFLSLTLYWKFSLCLKLHSITILKLSDGKSKPSTS